MTRSLLRAFSALAAFAIAMTGLSVLNAAPAFAESSNVTATCSTLTVKPNGFASKGEVRVLVDGEIQTEGTEDGRRSFKGSFTSVYAFDPTSTHDYTVEINSFGADSAGRDFAPGSGNDYRFEGPTTPCETVHIDAAASNCVAADRVDKQLINLTFSDLRKSVTYLAEVVHDGEVVQHFQFRTAPSTTKTFSGLTAGERYDVRVIDQTDEALSSSVNVLIPGCAARASVELSAPQCIPASGTAELTATIDGLVEGRDYTAELSRGTGSAAAQAVTGIGDAAVSFSGVPVGSGYTVTVSDDAAPRAATSEPVSVLACATPGGAGTPGGTPAIPGRGTTGGTGAPLSGTPSGTSVVPSRTPARSSSVSDSAAAASGSATATVQSAVQSDDLGTPAVETKAGSALQTSVQTTALSATGDASPAGLIQTLIIGGALLLLTGVLVGPAAGRGRRTV